MRILFTLLLFCCPLVGFSQLNFEASNEYESSLKEKGTTFNDVLKMQNGQVIAVGTEIHSKKDKKIATAGIFNYTSGSEKRDIIISNEVYNHDAKAITAFSIDKFFVVGSKSNKKEKEGWIKKLSYKDGEIKTDLDRYIGERAQFNDIVVTFDKKIIAVGSKNKRPWIVVFDDQLKVLKEFDSWAGTTKMVSVEKIIKTELKAKNNKNTTKYNYTTLIKDKDGIHRFAQLLEINETKINVLNSNISVRNGLFVEELKSTCTFVPTDMIKTMDKGLAFSGFLSCPERLPAVVVFNDKLEMNKERTHVYEGHFWSEGTTLVELDNRDFLLGGYGKSYRDNATIAKGFVFQNANTSNQFWNESNYESVIEKMIKLDDGQLAAIGSTKSNKKSWAFKIDYKEPKVENLTVSIDRIKNTDKIGLNVKSYTAVKYIRVYKNNSKYLELLTPKPTSRRKNKMSFELPINAKIGDNLSIQVVTNDGAQWVDKACYIEQRRIALVVGNSDYSNAGYLPCAANDANDMAEKLESLDFEVVLEKNLTKERMSQVMEKFIEKAKDYDVRLFFYAGHGYEKDGENLLQLIKEKGDDDGYILADDIYKQMNQYNANDPSSIVILDACRGEGIRSGFRVDPVSLEDEASTNALLENFFIFYSTSEGYGAYDCKDDSRMSNSPFTAALLKYMDYKNEKITDIYTNVVSDVKKSSQAIIDRMPEDKKKKASLQVPGLDYRGITNTFYFNPEKPKTTVSPWRE